MSDRSMTAPYLIGHSLVPPETHRGLVADLDAADAHSVDPGHTLLRMAPDARAILDDCAVVDALGATFGGCYTIDPCRHVHSNSHPSPGPWHRDDYCGQRWPEDQRWAILCYFPQDTPVEMGPTQVIARSGVKVTAAGPAGTFIVMDADLMHRATANITGRNRYMLKFLFRATGTPLLVRPQSAVRAEVKE